MPVRRRELLSLTAAGAGTLALGGCDRVLGGVADLVSGGVPDRVELARGDSVDPAHHLLDRAAFGPWPGDLSRVRDLGYEGWIAEQLSPDDIDDTACDLRTAFIDTVHVPADLAFEFRPEHVEAQLVTYTLLRATYSKRQLREVMVSFWTDHFNIAIGKDLCRHLKTSDDREVIRPHALGRFRDLLEASALSPAMLVYLDGRDNQRTGPDDVPNENYARELLELHTLGVHGGYTQKDVMEAARCLTGWVVREEWAPGAVEFVPERHDDSDKTVLGTRIPAGGGERDLSRLLDVLVAHPSCARHLAGELCRFFVSDEPPASIVDHAARRFVRSDGDIGQVVEAILLSEEFRASAGTKLKRPFRYVVSALRAVGAETNGRGFGNHLARLGQLPFSYPTPDGFPARGDAWLGTLLARWNFALDLAEGRIDGTRVDYDRLRRAIGAGVADPVEPTLRHLYGRAPTREELAAIGGYAPGRPADRRALALMLSSPGFQWS